MGESLLRSRLIVRQSLDAIATVVWGILTVYLGSFLSNILTLSISQRQTVKVPNFRKILLRSRPTIRQILDSLAIVVLKIFIVYLGSFLSDFLTLSISQQQTFKLPNFGEILLRSKPTVRQNFNALATVVLEILTVYLGSFLGDFLTLSMTNSWSAKLGGELAQVKTSLPKVKFQCLSLGPNSKASMTSTLTQCPLIWS